jgi:hypothetical protein
MSYGRGITGLEGAIESCAPIPTEDRKPISRGAGHGPIWPGHRVTARKSGKGRRGASGAARAQLARMTTTAWGRATIVEEVTVPQTASGKEFSTLVQLLEGSEGESLVRFAYATGDTARRGPVTLRPADIHRLKRALVKAPRLRAALQWT